MVAFSDTLTKAIYDNNPRAARITAGDFKQISYPRIMEMYKERFADTSDFIFTFVGNIDTDSIRPFVEQYLATLPGQRTCRKSQSRRSTGYPQGRIHEYLQTRSGNTESVGCQLLVRQDGI